jgi:hypothetical protein
MHKRERRPVERLLASLEAEIETQQKNAMLKRQVLATNSDPCKVLSCVPFLISVYAGGVWSHASQSEFDSDCLISHFRGDRFAQSSQLFSTVSRTLLVYSLRLSLYRLLASTFAGLLVFGSLSKLCTLVKIAATSYVGLQRFCRMSRHNSPVA